MTLSAQLLQKIELTKNPKFLQVMIRQDITQEESNQIEEYAKEQGLSLRMTLANLTDKEKISLREMHKFIGEMEAIPDSQKEPIPEKILDRWQSEVG